jgi:putative salt-induced outer membrane protein
MFMKRTILAAAVLGLASFQVQAIDWKPSAELGLVITSGNSDTSSVNGKFAIHGEDEAWIHDYGIAALRAEVDDNTTANRYDFGGKSGKKLSERSYIFGALRYENDDFAPFEYQTTVSFGYGYFAIKNDLTTLLFEVGPGYRRVKPLGSDDTEGDVVARGLMDYKHKFNEHTEFFDTLLIEAGSDNTFAQNDIGVAVKMSDALALKAGLQVRYNSETAPGIDSTDTLTTVNVVWTPAN